MNKISPDWIKALHSQSKNSGIKKSLYFVSLLNPMVLKLENVKSAKQLVSFDIYYGDTCVSRILCGT